MQLPHTLQPGKLLRRYKRFLADVELPGGQVVVVHCPNPGSMLGCAEPGAEVWLRKSLDPKRRLPYTWVITHWQNTFISVDTLLANKLVGEAIAARRIPQLSEFQHILPEFKLGDSRFDFCLYKTADKLPPACIVEVKSTTLAYGKTAMFPDAKTERGRKHLEGLMAARQDGYRAVQFYCVSRNDIATFEPAEHIDSKYAQALRQAVAKGVEVMAWATEIKHDDGSFYAELVREIPVAV